MPSNNSKCSEEFREQTVRHIFETGKSATSMAEEKGIRSAPPKDSIDESRYDFCVNNGWQEYIDRMLVVDYLILNRDRHGANVEVLRDARRKTLRIAPLFDHGLSFLCSCQSSDEIMQFDILEDKPCQNFFGSRSTYENLKYIENKQNVFANVLEEEDKELLLADLETALSKEHLDKIWDMLWARWCEYEKFLESMMNSWKAQSRLDIYSIMRRLKVLSLNWTKN